MAMRTKALLALLVLSAAARAQPVATLSEGSLAFGGQSMRTSSPSQAITLTNTGDALLVVSSVSASPVDFTRTHDCANLAPGAMCTINVTFTPQAGPGAVNSTQAVSGTLAVVSNGAGSPNEASLHGTSEKSLVGHYYRSILRRAADAGGKEYWQNEAARVVGLGASVNEVWYALSMTFYASPEYLAFNPDSTGFVTDLYNTFFNRAPDAGGLAYWKGLVDGGLPREVALAAFMFSPEFASFTTAIFGTPVVRAETNMVMDFYRGLLSRSPDNGGFAFWVDRFRAAQCQGAATVTAEVEAISSAFALSGEYAGRGRNNTQYVGDLYNAFLRRGGDAGGVQYWINEIDSGARTREQVRVEFRNSPEFQARVNAVVQEGCVPAPSAPAAATGEATAIGAAAATLNATVNDNGAVAAVAFELGATASYGTPVAATPASLGPAAGLIAVTARVTGLACGTTYHYRVSAQNSVGGATGADSAFTTSPCPAAPTATTGAASDIGANGANLNGVANDNRSDTAVTFEFGTTLSYGSSVPAVPGALAAGTGSTVVGASISGLSCGTTYNVRIRAVNSIGVTNGANQTFRTTECSPCPAANVLCVSASAGPDQEYATIQAALDVANAGDTVLVFDGTYAGVIVTRSGAAGNPIVLKAKGAGAVIGSLNAASPASAIRIQNASHITVEGFRIENLAGHGLTARSATSTAPMRGITFRGNTLVNNAANILVSQLADSLIENNVVTASQANGIRVDSPGSDNTVIRGNVVTGSAGNGLYFDSSPGSDGLPGLQTGIVIEGNTIAGNAQSGINSEGLKDAVIRNNLVANNALHGIRALQGGAPSGPENLQIVGNTIAGVGSAGGRAAIKFTNDMGGHTIFNNVLQSGDGAIHVGSPNLKSDHNAIAAASFSLDGGTTPMSLALWRAQAGGYDASSVAATAVSLFVNPASDFRLAGGSPAANAGAATFDSVLAPAIDLLGVTRPQGGAHDIGAFESF